MSCVGLEEGLLMGVDIVRKLAYFKAPLSFFPFS